MFSSILQMWQLRHHEIKPFAQGCTVSGRAEVQRDSRLLYFAVTAKLSGLFTKFPDVFSLQEFYFLGLVVVVGGWEEQIVWKINHSEQRLFIPEL